MPISNPTPKSFASLDPEVRGITASLNYLMKFSLLFPTLDKYRFSSEVRNFQYDSNLSIITETRIDKWWSRVPADKYPQLINVAKTALSCFYGAIVESTFSEMGNIVTKAKTNLNVPTYSAYQTIRYHLKSQNMTAVEKFGRSKPLISPVDSELTRNMRPASSRYREDLKSTPKPTTITKKEANSQVGLLYSHTSSNAEINSAPTQKASALKETKLLG
ncbi:hypothetical protein RRG08_002563 [Elysia crispata]|uniref:HAT C-terminal dimerisation domain-containing protein n=1 Tax=Elysia crispata TaxID=231223 RepID=A0AAE1CSG1_9GAST|nr:hypothetical protein RRG08_002563 [Elysia crispata]